MSGEPNLCLDIRGNIVMKHLMDTSFRLLHIFGISTPFIAPASNAFPSSINSSRLPESARSTLDRPRQGND
jgi:hypothetical protein